MGLRNLIDKITSDPKCPCCTRIIACCICNAAPDRALKRAQPREILTARKGRK